MFCVVQKVYSAAMASVTVDAILDRFRRVGALLEGHFRLTSGLHSPGYLQCALVLQHPAEAEACGAALADRVRASRCGGWCSRPPSVESSSGTRWRARSACAPSSPNGRIGALTLRRGFTIAPGERVLVVEDVVTTGGSTRETIEVARAQGPRWWAPPPSSTAAAVSSGSTFRFTRWRRRAPDVSGRACPLCAEGSRW